MLSTVRLATLDDLPSIQKVATRSWHHTYRESLSIFSIQQFLEQAYSLERLTLRLKQTNLYVVEQDHQVVGFANFSKVDKEGVGSLIAIYLLPEHQGQGLGSKLIQFAMKELRNLTVIHLEVSTDNKQAIHFYCQKGFKWQEEYCEPFFEDVLHTTKMTWTRSS